MAVVYEHPTYGVFWLTELNPQQTTDDLIKQVEDCQTISCGGDPAMVEVQGGESALLVSTEGLGGVTTLTWIDGSVQVVLQGPSDVFTRDAAVAAVDEI